MSEEVLINESQAYAAMFFFLENIYKRTSEDALGQLLGAMSWLQDATPVDPAFFEE